MKVNDGERVATISIVDRFEDEDGEADDSVEAQETEATEEE